MVVPIDLFGKIKDFSGSDNYARDYENKLNEVQVMARELGVHFILVAQIHREATKGKFKRPKMSNLKNSGAFEEVADIILAVHRPYYDPEVALKDYSLAGEAHQDMLEDDSDLGVPNDEKNIAEVIILKQRMGAQNVIVNFEFDPMTTRFRPYDLVEQNEFNAYRINEFDQEGGYY